MLHGGCRGCFGLWEVWGLSTWGFRVLITPITTYKPLVLGLFGVYGLGVNKGGSRFRHCFYSHEYSYRSCLFLGGTASMGLGFCHLCFVVGAFGG